jgi:hypothetical protein
MHQGNEQKNCYREISSNLNQVTGLARAFIQIQILGFFRVAMLRVGAKKTTTHSYQPRRATSLSLFCFLMTSDTSSSSENDSLSSDSSATPCQVDTTPPPQVVQVCSDSVERSLSRRNKRSLSFEVEKQLLEDIEEAGGLHGDWSREKQPVRKLLDLKPLHYPKDTKFRDAARQRIRYLNEMPKSDYILLLSQFSVEPYQQQRSKKFSSPQKLPSSSSKEPFSSSKRTPSKKTPTRKSSVSTTQDVPTVISASPPKPTRLFVSAPLPPLKPTMTTPTTLDTKLEKRFGTYGKRSD